jgi:hypothetical protein
MRSFEFGYPALFLRMDSAGLLTYASTLASFPLSFYASLSPVLSPCYLLSSPSFSLSAPFSIAIDFQVLYSTATDFVPNRNENDFLSYS